MNLDNYVLALEDLAEQPNEILTVQDLLSSIKTKIFYFYFYLVVWTSSILLSNSIRQIDIYQCSLNDEKGYLLIDNYKIFNDK
jgi:hypothetical protein